MCKTRWGNRKKTGFAFKFSTRKGQASFAPCQCPSCFVAFKKRLLSMSNLIYDIEKRRFKIARDHYRHTSILLVNVQSGLGHSKIRRAWGRSRHASFVCFSLCKTVRDICKRTDSKLQENGVEMLHLAACQCVEWFGAFKLDRLECTRTMWTWIAGPIVLRKPL